MIAKVYPFNPKEKIMSKNKESIFEEARKDWADDTK